MLKGLRPWAVQIVDPSIFFNRINDQIDPDEYSMQTRSMVCISVLGRGQQLSAERHPRAAFCEKYTDA